MIDVLHEVIVTPRRAFPRLPGLRVIERPGWLQIVTPSLGAGGLNEVIYSRLEPEGADAVIDEAIAIYRDLGVVLPRFRGRGLYRALVQARLADAHSLGIALATTHAREASSAPILEKLGFATACRFAMYLG